MVPCVWFSRLGLGRGSGSGILGGICLRAWALLPPPPSSFSYMWAFLPCFLVLIFSCRRVGFSPSSFFLHFSFFLSLLPVLFAPPFAVLPPTPFFFHPVIVTVLFRARALFGRLVRFRDGFPSIPY